MNRYVMLLNWTDQGVRAAKDTVKRAADASKAAEKAGAKITLALWTLGQYDLLLCAEAPDDTTIAAIGLKLGMLGNVKTLTMRAFDEKEMEQILKRT